MATTRSLSAVLGGCRELALFEAFAVRKNKALSAADVERFTGVSWATTHRRLADWAKSGVLDQVAKDGKALLYQLNLDSPSVRALTKAVNTAIVELLEADLVEDGVPEAALERMSPVSMAEINGASQRTLFPGAYGIMHEGLVIVDDAPVQRRFAVSWGTGLQGDQPPAAA